MGKQEHQWGIHLCQQKRNPLHLEQNAEQNDTNNQEPIGTVPIH